MVNEELLLSISELLDKKIGPMEKRMDDIETTLYDKFDNLEKRLDAKIDGVEQRLDAKIDAVEQSLRGEIHKINLKLENDIEPRLQNIEQCYLDTHRRYQYGVDKIEKLEADNELIRSVLQKHIQSHSA